MKKILWIIGGSLLFIIILIGAGIWFIVKEMKEDDPEYVLELTKKQASSKTVALSIVHNGTHIARVNDEQALPLASTMKIIVAIEYAQQAAKGMIDPDKKVSIKELERYYLPKTDGGAHEAWLTYLKTDRQTEVEEVPIHEVANGMIAFSSNANTDFLMNLLGLDKINDVLEQLELTKHDPLYPMGSAMFIPAHLMEIEDLSKKEALKVLESMSMADYRKKAFEIAERQGEAPPTAEEKKELVSTMDMKFQKVWSDRLPRDTTQDYVSLLKKLNSKKYFSKEVHTYLDPVLEQLMQNPKNQEWLHHAGQKGGSTAFVLTKAMYAEDKEGNQTEVVFFANELNRIEQMMLTRKMNSFQLKIMTDSSFRSKVEKELGASKSVQ